MKDLIQQDQIIYDDAFRNAFVAISRAAVPHLNVPIAYMGDLVHDASYATNVPEGATYYILVREVGTNTYDDAYDAMQRCESKHYGDGRAVVRVQRGRFDTFTAKVIYTRDGVVRFK
jgi:hypothetical protein